MTITLQMLRDLAAFLTVLNPFALCLYLVGVMDDLSHEDFLRVLLRATLISLGVFILFALGGEALLTEVLGVRTEALRIFGGVIFFTVAYGYVTRGYKAVDLFRGSLEELPSEIALPFMIGAGTITQSIMIGKHGPAGRSIVILTASAFVSLGVVLAFKALRDRMRGRRELLISRHVNTLSRINGLLIGALSTEMIVGGLRGLWMMQE